MDLGDGKPKRKRQDVDTPDEHPPEALERFSTSTARVNSPTTETMKPAGAGKGTGGRADSKPAAKVKQKQPSKKRPHLAAAADTSEHHKRRAPSSSEQLTFPERLMQLVNESMASGHVEWIEEEEAISFRTNGFQDHVLDKFFQGLKYDSFVRKLNRWGFRRVTSERVPTSFVAYYHNSFRKEEQDLLRTMGIGKKNDPAVRDMQALGGDLVAIGSAPSAAAAGSVMRESIEASASSPSPQRPITFSGVSSPVAAPSNPYAAPPTAALSNPYAVASQQIGNLAAAASLPSSSIQESKSDVASMALARAGVPQLDAQQMVLEAMLAQQRQNDMVALQQRQAAMLSERLFLQQSQQQQRANANAALGTALGGRNDELALKFLAAQSGAFGQQAQPFQDQQLSFPSLQSSLSQLSSDPALALLLHQYSQQQCNASANPIIPGGARLPNPNTLANLAAANDNRAQGGNPDLESLVTLLLEERRRRAGRGPGQGPGPQR